MLRVVFFGNSEGVFSNRHFAALREIPCELAAVVDVPPARRGSTNARSPDGQNFVEYAREEGISAHEPASPNLPEFVELMRGLQPDLFLAVGYLNRLREGLLETPRLLSVNFHASLLPAYRGLHPVFRTLRGSERWAGLTVHVLDAGLDTGDILYQMRVRTRHDDSVGSLYDRIMDRSITLVGRLISDAEAGKLKHRPQAAGEGSYFSSVSEDDFRLDWRRRAEELRRWICTTPGRCFLEGSMGRVFVLDAKVTPDRGAPPGEIVRVGRTRCTVAAFDGGLALGKVRTDAGVQNAASWAKRERLEVGERIACH